MKYRHKLKLAIYAAITILIMAAIFFMSSQNAGRSSMLSEGFLNTWIGRILARILPDITGKGIFNDIRKYAHLFEYFCLGISTALFFLELMRGQTVRPVVFSVVSSLLYACTDEWHQLYVPGRAGRISDVGIDLIGIVLGVAAVCLLTGLRRKNTD